MSAPPRPPLKTLPPPPLTALLPPPPLRPTVMSRFSASYVWYRTSPGMSSSCHTRVVGGKGARGAGVGGRVLSLWGAPGGGGGRQGKGEGRRQGPMCTGSHGSPSTLQAAPASHGRAPPAVLSPRRPARRPLQLAPPCGSLHSGACRQQSAVRSSPDPHPPPTCVGPTVGCTSTTLPSLALAPRGTRPPASAPAPHLRRPHGRVHQHDAIVPHVGRVPRAREQLIVRPVDGVAALERDHVGAGGQRGADLGRRRAREDAVRAGGGGARARLGAGRDARSSRLLARTPAAPRLPPTPSQTTPIEAPRSPIALTPPPHPFHPAYPPASPTPTHPHPSSSLSPLGQLEPPHAAAQVVAPPLH